MNPIKVLENGLLAAIANNPGDLANVAAILLETLEEEGSAVLRFMLIAILEGNA